MLLQLATQVAAESIGNMRLGCWVAFCAPEWSALFWAWTLVPSRPTCPCFDLVSTPTWPLVPVLLSVFCHVEAPLFRLLMWSLSPHPVSSILLPLDFQFQHLPFPVLPSSVPFLSFTSQSVISFHLTIFSIPTSSFPRFLIQCCVQACSRSMS